MSPSTPPDWPSLFDTLVERACPAIPGDVSAVLGPVTEPEAVAIVGHQRNPWRPTDPHHGAWQPINPRCWHLPTGTLPSDFRAFLDWSDGATWQTGEREFSCFGCKHLREYLLHYHFPEYMPGALPIGLDGGGVFCVFNLDGPRAGALWAIGSGALDWEIAVPIADSFVEFCKGRTSVGDVYGGGLAAKREAT